MASAEISENKAIALISYNQETKSKYGDFRFLQN